MPDPAPALGRTYKVADIADYLDVTLKRVYGWIQDGTLPALRLPGRKGHATIRIRRQDFDEFERQWLGQNSASPDTASAAEAPSGTSAGPTPEPGRRSPFQRGKVVRLRPGSGGTSS